MPPKLRSKAIVESLDSGSKVVEAAHEGRVPALVEQIENLMNSLVRQQGNPSNNSIEQVEGRGVGNVNVPILFFNNFNEFSGSHVRNKEPVSDHDCFYGINEAAISIHPGEP